MGRVLKRIVVRVLVISVMIVVNGLIVVFLMCGRVFVVYILINGSVMDVRSRLMRFFIRFRVRDLVISCWIR